MTDSFYNDNPDNEADFEFCISPYGSKEATEKVWKERQRQREGKGSGSLWIDLMEQQHKREQECRNQGQDPGAIPPRNLGSNRFGRGNRGRWNGPGNN